MNSRCLISLCVSLPLIAFACSSTEDSNPEPDKGLLAEPPFDGKADVGDRVIDAGDLLFGPESAVTGVFNEDLMFFGWRLSVRENSTLTLEVTQKGSSRGLDTSLFLYGPKSPGGGYGTSAIAYDDDSGWGTLSRLRDLSLPSGGEYLVVVGTFDGRGRGNFRVQATCLSGECSPEPEPEPSETHCHPAIVNAILACVDDGEADPYYDPSITSRIDLIENCTDPEPVAPAWDALCSQPEPPTEVCDFTIEQFSTSYLPACGHELVHQELDNTCVFGTAYPDLFWRPNAIVILSERTLTAADSLTDLEQSQVLQAVRMTAYDDVTTVEEAFASVDENIVNVMDLWDASNRRAFTSYEVGAGDNSFGVIFDYGTTNPAARIHDSDLMDCNVLWGPEMRRCNDSTQCAEGLSCVGVVEHAKGRCIDTNRDDEHFFDCSSSEPCPAELGLVCACGICNPGWMRGRFVSEPNLPIPDGNPKGVDAELQVFGLSTVSTDVTLDLSISHTRPSDLIVSVINPEGTEVIVFDQEPTSYGLYMRSVPVFGFPGDESANGVWRLRAIDTTSGATGHINSFTLTVTSRWD